MAVTPSRGTPGYRQTDAASPKRSETVQRPWTFLETLVVKALRIFGGGGLSGQVLVATDDDGNIGFSSTLPATTVARTGGTITETATLFPSGTTGDYFATAYIECTTAGAAGTLDVTFSFTDDVGATTTPIIATLLLNATGRSSGDTVIRSNGGGIDYTFTVTAAAGGPVWSAYLSVTRVR